MNMSATAIFWLLVTFGIPSIVIFIFIARPEQIIRIQGKFYRYVYKEVRSMSDEEIDQFYQLPWDRFLMGRRSDFIRNAVDNPHSYTSLIKIYRIIGMIIAFFLLMTVMLFLIATAKGTFQ